MTIQEEAQVGETDSEAQTDNILIVLQVDHRERHWVDHIVRLVTCGLEHIVDSSNAVSYMNAITIDEKDAKLIGGLQAIHGNGDASEHRDEIWAWNAARAIVGGQPLKLADVPVYGQGEGGVYDDPIFPREWASQREAELQARATRAS